MNFAQALDMLTITGDYADSVLLDVDEETVTSSSKQIFIRTPSRTAALDALDPPIVKIDGFLKGRIDIGMFPGAVFETERLQQVDLTVKRIAVGSAIFIGEGTSINEATFWCHKGDIRIGSDCMLSENIHVYGHDEHALIDIATKQVLNHERFGVTIRDHVWIGRGATIMPGVDIGHGSIIGARAVVTRSVDINCVAAGNPARVVRQNASWSRKLATAGPDFHAYFEDYC